MNKKVINVIIIIMSVNLLAGASNKEFKDTYIVCTDIMIAYRFFNDIKSDLYTDTNDVVYTIKLSNVNAEHVWQNIINKCVDSIQVVEGLFLPLKYVPTHIMFFDFKTQYGSFKARISEHELERGYIVLKHPNKKFKINFSDEGKLKIDKFFHSILEGMPENVHDLSTASYEEKKSNESK